MSTTATDSLAAAWIDRAQRAAEKLRHMEAAPALFRPEAVERTRADYLRAVEQVRYWRGIGAS